MLAKGELWAKLKLRVTGASKAAVAAIEKAGGAVTVTGVKGASASADDSEKESTKKDSTKKDAKKDPVSGGREAAPE